MSGGARRAEPPPVSALKQYAGVAAVVAILAVIGGLLFFGDDLVGGPGGDQDKAPELTAAQKAEKAQREDEVVTAATKVLTTWSRPELDYKAWWRGLKPLLTPGGQEAYAFSDPGQVPLLIDIAADRIVLNPSDATATVWFTTTIGQYGVDMSRKDATGDWLANRVVFPGEKSMFE